jgi:hypothetical protein
MQASVKISADRRAIYVKRAPNDGSPPLVEAIARLKSDYWCQQLIGALVEKFGLPKLPVATLAQTYQEAASSDRTTMALEVILAIAAHAEKSGVKSLERLQRHMMDWVGAPRPDRDWLTTPGGRLYQRGQKPLDAIRSSFKVILSKSYDYYNAMVPKFRESPLKYGIFDLKFVPDDVTPWRIVAAKLLEEVRDSFRELGRALMHIGPEEMALANYFESESARRGFRPPAALTDSFEVNGELIRKVLRLAGMDETGIKQLFAPERMKSKRSAQQRTLRRKR